MILNNKSKPFHNDEPIDVIMGASVHENSIDILHGKKSTLWMRNCTLKLVQVP